MSEFIKWIKYAFLLAFRPETNRATITDEAGTAGTRVFIVLALPFLLLSCLASGYHYDKIDGIRSGILVFASMLVFYLISVAIFVSLTRYIFKEYAIDPRTVLYNLAFLFFWIFLGDLLATVAQQNLGIFGVVFILILKLGSVWVANLSLNEILFAQVSVETGRLKAISNWMTLSLIIVGLILPYLIGRILEWVVMRVM